MDFRALWSEFRKSRYFRAFYVSLAAVFAAVLLPIPLFCLSLLLIPLSMLLIPHWFGERRVRNHAWNGLIIIVVASVVHAVLFTPTLTDQPQQVQAVDGERAKLSEGRVVPFRAAEDAPFNFTVSLTTADPDAANFTVQVQVLDVGAFEAVPRILEMTRDRSRADGNLSNGEPFFVNATLPPLLHAFNFQVVTVVNTTQEVVVQTTGNAGPFNAPYPTYFAFMASRALFALAFIGLGFYLILLLYWWTRRARELRGARPAGRRKRAEGGGEFTCTNCGADVAEEDTKCPNCGAVFEPEAEGEPAEARP